MMSFLLVSAITGGYAAVSFVFTLLNTPDPRELIGTDEDPIVGVSLHAIEKHRNSIMLRRRSNNDRVSPSIQRVLFNHALHQCENENDARTQKLYPTPFEPTPYTTSFVNTMEELRVLQQHYSTPDTFVKFPIIFPMKAQEYRWPTRVYIDYLTRCIGTSRRSIKINACMARRLPLSLTAAAVCVLGIGLHEW